MCSSLDLCVHDRPKEGTIVYVHIRMAIFRGTMTTMYMQTFPTISHTTSTQKGIAEVADFLRRETVKIQIFPERSYSEAEQIRPLHSARRQTFTEGLGTLRLEEGNDIGDCPAQHQCPVVRLWC